MYKMASIALAALLLIGFIVMQQLKIDTLDIKNNSLKSKLKVCKSLNGAKEFEIKWASEFSRVYDLNISDIENPKGLEDEKISTQSDSNISYSDTF